jgi:diguanylate cyclase (GGDEF)-like protein/hemerythrin-like metal-binding protein
MSDLDIITKTTLQRGSAVLLLVGLLSSLGVYFGHAWFHGSLLPGIGVEPALGDALGGFAIILIAYLGQRLTSLLLFRDTELGNIRSAQKLQKANQKIRRELTELDRLASTDKLTGCWNRHRLEEVSRGEMDRLKRYDHALSLLIIDIDFFKRINDHHGHHVGDLVLVRIAEQIKSFLRTSDSLTRWGGEEFIALCPSTKLATALVLAERVRERISTVDFPAVGNITISIGVAECLADEGWDAWLQRADAALYRAKNNGRNQIQHAPETPSREAATDAVPPNIVKLIWHQSYVSGNETIDREHQSLFDVANKLLDAILSKRPADEVSAIVNQLVRDVNQHFTDEEAELAAAGYPLLAEHAATHRALADKAALLMDRFQNNSLDVGELFQFLAHDLIARHILSGDRDYFPYVQQTPQASPARIE